jgi:hypothetical protein
MKAAYFQELHDAVTLRTAISGKRRASIALLVFRETWLRLGRDLSAYFPTITIINSAVEWATAGAMRLCDVPGAMLRGIAAVCLNFVAIVGPFCGSVVLLAVGLFSKGPAWATLLPAALYFGTMWIHDEAAVLIRSRMPRRYEWASPVVSAWRTASGRIGR